MPINFSSAREVIEDWYIKDYFISYKINLDSSIEVQERITADCGDNLRRGIFRVINQEGLVIRDIQVKDRVHQIIYRGNLIEIDMSDDNAFVSGENEYIFSYKILRAIRDNELYYNILAHNWSLEIDNFTAQIIFPEGLDKNNVEISLYSGSLGRTDNQLANYQWISDNVLEVYSKDTFLAGQGITISASFPEGIIDVSNNIWQSIFIIVILLFLISPLLAFLIAWYFFSKHKKKNPYFKKAVVPQYAPPDNLSPIRLAYIIQSNQNLGQLITATIIRFASLKLITVSDKERKALFIKYNTLEFKKTTTQSNYNQLDEIEKYIFDLIFKDRDILETKDLRKILITKTQTIAKKLKINLRENEYLLTKTPSIKIAYALIGIALFILMSPFSAIVMLIFYGLISIRTEKGERVAWENKGFLMFLKIAKQDRHRFYEKENIFTKLLPYAIAFNLTTHFLKQMESIYGQEQVKSQMSWYTGYTNLNSINSLSAKLNSISSQINSTTSSGRGGMGSSGGGRGGGGGGGR